jgi:hypothetical protein
VLHITLLISLESSWCVGVHWFGLRLFEVSMCKLLIIEPFFQWKLNKIENKSCIGICGCSWCCGKACSKSDLIEFISQILELRCRRYWFFSDFFCWKFKQITKFGFGRKNQLNPQFVDMIKFRKKLILKMWKIKNVFTLGPIAHTTLVHHKGMDWEVNNKIWVVKRDKKMFESW